MQALREAQNEKSSLYNAFTAFLHHLKCFGPDGVRIWNALSDRTKKEWCKMAKSTNEASFKSLKEMVVAFEEYEEKVGPLGSPSRDCFIDEDEVSNLVQCSESKLVEDWMVKNLSVWKNGFARVIALSIVCCSLLLIDRGSWGCFLIIGPML